MSERPFALLTGAAGGIGIAVGRRLRQRGYQVIAAEHNQERAQQAAQAIGEGSLAIACDLCDRESVGERGRARYLRSLP